MSDSDEIEREVAFGALGGWRETFTEALERYCKHCRGLAPRELQRRPNVLLDFNLWADPQEAAQGRPLRVGAVMGDGGSMDLERAATLLADRADRGLLDAYAVLGTIRRECEK